MMFYDYLCDWRGRNPRISLFLLVQSATLQQLTMYTMLSQYPCLPTPLMWKLWLELYSSCQELPVNTMLTSCFISTWYFVPLSPLAAATADFTSDLSLPVFPNTIFQKNNCIFLGEKHSRFSNKADGIVTALIHWHWNFQSLSEHRTTNT